MTYRAWLIWLHDRLVNVYRENPNVDYLHKLREVIASLAKPEVQLMRGIVVLDSSDGRIAFRADDVVSITEGQWKDVAVTRLILRDGERFYVTKPFDEIVKTVWGNFTSTGVNNAA